jgi:hypothetical protein
LVDRFRMLLLTRCLRPSYDVYVIEGTPVMKRRQNDVVDDELNALIRLEDLTIAA